MGDCSDVDTQLELGIDILLGDDILGGFGGLGSETRWILTGQSLTSHPRYQWGSVSHGPLAVLATPPVFYHMSLYGAGHLNMLAPWHSWQLSKSWLVFMKTRVLRLY